MADGGRLLTAGRAVRLWSGAGGELLLDTPPLRGGTLTGVAWIPIGGGSIARAQSDGTIELVSTTGVVERTIKNTQGVAVRALAFSATGKQLWTGDDAGTLSCFELTSANPSPAKSIPVFSVPIVSISINCIHSHVAVSTRDGQLSVLNTANGAPQAFVTECAGALSAISFNPFRKGLLVAGCDDGRVRLWDILSSTLPLHTFETPHAAPCRAVAFSPQNKNLMASAGLDRRIFIYDVDKKAILRPLAVDTPLTSVTFRADGQTIIAGSNNGTIFSYALRTNTTSKSTVDDDNTSVSVIAIKTITAAPVKLPTAESTSTAKPAETTRPAAAPPASQPAPSQPTAAPSVAKPTTALPVTKPTTALPVTKAATSPSSAPSAAVPLAAASLPATKPSSDKPAQPQPSPSAVAPTTDEIRARVTAADRVNAPRGGLKLSNDPSALQQSPAPHVPAAQTKPEPRAVAAAAPVVPAVPPTQAGPLFARDGDEPFKSVDFGRSKLHVLATGDQSGQGARQEKPLSGAAGLLSKEGSPGLHSKEGSAPSSSSASHQTSPLSSRATSSTQLSPLERTPYMPPGAAPVAGLPLAVEEAIESLRISLHQQVQNLHVEMIQQFYQQRKDMEQMLRAMVPTDALMEELRLLREENARLRNIN